MAQSLLVKNIRLVKAACRGRHGQEKLDLKGFTLIELMVVIAGGGGFFVFKKVQEVVKPIQMLVIRTMTRTMRQIAPIDEDDNEPVQTE